MSKFLDQTGLSHFWGKIKTLLAGKADKTYVDNACDGVYNMVSGELAGKADSDHFHDEYRVDIDNIFNNLDSVNELVNDFNTDLAYLYENKADKTHTHDDYVTTTYLDSMRYVSEQDLSTQIQNTEGLIQDVDDRVTALENASGGTTAASHKFKILGRQTLSANGCADLSAYLSAYDELMIIVRTQSSAAVTIGPASNTSGSSGFLCSKSVTGNIYTKIMVNKTDEGYMAWDVGGELGWSNSTAYRYLRNYSASGTVTMTVVVHGR